jgi:peptidyl-prolyl cis-trans isomerase SurA
MKRLIRMKKLVSLVSLILFSNIAMFSFAQSDNDIVLEVANEKITKKEFIDMYQRNNTNPQKKIIKKDLQDYLELFINYKLKIAEAKHLGLDTMPAYIEEVSSYRKQLVEPYLNDKTVTEDLINEAYQRSKEIIRASHILISIPTNATPNDTLEAYNKALSIRNRILKGEDFSKLAILYSDDPSAKDQERKDGQNAIKGNGGDLGYFTSFSMIYPFETACYNMKVGELSMPVRSQRGYHIIKVSDRKPAPFATCSLAHIWVNFNEHNSAEECKRLIDQAYEMLKNNVRFDSVALKYSDDKYSAQNQGILTSQKVVTMPLEYTDMIMETPINQLSEPFSSRYGWHIIKPLSLVPVGSLEQQRQSIEQRIARDVRSYRTIEEFVRKSKIEYGFKEDLSKINVVIDLVTDSVFVGSWEVPNNFIGNDIIFSIGDYSFTQKDLAKEIEKAQRTQTPEYIPTYVDNIYKRTADRKIKDYADSKLESKHPDLKITVDEFRDGILIFSITDRFVWNKSITDSIGAEEFYQKNKNRYQWKERADATTFGFYKDLDLNKAKKVIEKGIKKNKSNDEIIINLTKKLKIKDEPSKYFDYKWGKYEKGDNKVVDNSEWKHGISNVIEDGNRKCIVVIHSIIPPTTKLLNEAKGIVTSEYQEYLEAQWIKKLRDTYTYKVHTDVFNSITSY